MEDEDKLKTMNTIRLTLNYVSRIVGDAFESPTGHPQLPIIIEENKEQPKNIELTWIENDFKRYDYNFLVQYVLDRYDEMSKEIRQELEELLKKKGETK